MPINTPQYLCHKCLCPQGKLPHPPPLPSQETLQDQQVGQVQTLMKLLLFLLVPVHLRFCVHPLRMKSLFPPGL